MSVNDIVTFEAKPLIFLNYFATSHPNVDLSKKVHVIVNCWGCMNGVNFFCISNLVLIIYISSSIYKRYC